MAGIFGILQRSTKAVLSNNLTQVCEQLSIETHRKDFNLHDGNISVSWLPNKPLKGDFYREYDDTLFCFCGDIGGVRMIDARHIRLPMPPPEFHPDEWRLSLEKLRQSSFTHLLPTHFGAFSDIDWHLDAIERTLDEVGDWMAVFMPQNLPGERLKAEFLRWEAARSRVDKIDPDCQDVYQTANPVEISLLGIQRYWKKFHPENQN